HRRLFGARRRLRAGDHHRGARPGPPDRSSGARPRPVRHQRRWHRHRLPAPQPQAPARLLSAADPDQRDRGGAGLDRVRHMTSPSQTRRRILAVTRLRARRLVLWMERVWHAGQATPGDGPTIGPGEVMRLLAADSMQAAEAAFLATGEAAALGASADAAAVELAADPTWTAICRVFGLGADETDLLALLVASEIDPGLARVIAYLHDDGRLTQPTPWPSARLARREP